MQIVLLWTWERPQILHFSEFPGDTDAAGRQAPQGVGRS